MTNPQGNQREDDFIARIVPDPSQPPDTILLTGYLGRSSEEGSTRLYFDPQLSNYVEISNNDILHIQEISREQSLLGGSYVWIRKEAELTHGKVGSERTRARFLEGPIFRDFMAAQAGGGAMPAQARMQAGIGQPQGLPQSLACPSALNVCPGTLNFNCPSVVDACPSVNVQCITLPPGCQTPLCPSVVNACPSVNVACPPPQSLICPSVAVVCPSVVDICPSVNVLCPPPQSLVCPSVAVVCPPPQTRVCPQTQPCPSIACPSRACPSIACGVNPIGGLQVGQTPMNVPARIGVQGGMTQPQALAQSANFVCQTLIIDCPTPVVPCNTNVNCPSINVGCVSFDIPCPPAPTSPNATCPPPTLTNPECPSVNLGCTQGCPPQTLLNAGCPPQTQVNPCPSVNVVCPSVNTICPPQTSPNAGCPPQTSLNAGCPPQTSLNAGCPPRTSPNAGCPPNFLPPPTLSGTGFC